MDIGFLVVMTSFFLGPIVLVIGASLIFWRRTRWFATSVLVAAGVVASLAALTMEVTPYTSQAVFLAAFTVVAIALGALVSVVWTVVAAIDTWERRHAA